MGQEASSSLRDLREHPFDLLKELEHRSRVAQAGAAGEAGDVTEWVGIGFRLGAEQFIVSRDEIREVLMVPSSVTRVPGAQAWLRGLSNVRGHILPLVDLRAFLGAGTGGAGRSSRVLVLNGADFPCGLLVDEVHGFRRFLETEHSQDAPDTMIRCERYLNGSFGRSGEHWPVFSTRRLAAAEEFVRAAAD
ncbi:MAG: chemotaxis protein CheW [Gammaproteobacteria bacterium]|nr:chemotaxis protein CheW [Gammaproteobacteria bacterium]